MRKRVLDTGTKNSISARIQAGSFSASNNTNSRRLKSAQIRHHRLRSRGARRSSIHLPSTSDGNANLGRRPRCSPLSEALMLFSAEALAVRKWGLARGDEDAFFTGGRVDGEDAGWWCLRVAGGVVRI